MPNALLERPGTEAGLADADRQVVVLHLGSEIYGVDIACVSTVLVPQPITQVPNVPDYVRGVMNLRGRILPVIDLRARFGMPPLSEEKQKSTRIMIIDAEGTAAGLIVDSVSEVLRLPLEAIESASGLLNTVDPSCLTGIGRVSSRHKNECQGEADRLILLLDAAQVLTLNSLPENYVPESVGQ